MHTLHQLISSIKGLLSAIGFALVLFLSVLVVKEIVTITTKINEPTTKTISISAQGKVLAKTNIARVNIGALSQAPSVEEAQKKNADAMNKVTQFLKESGVKEEDMQTQDYSIYPRYEYTPGGKQNSAGYDVSQSLQVKIRDLTKVGDILRGVAQNGANQVGTLDFTIDDQTKLEQEALQKAIQMAKEKAKNLTNQLGVRLGTVVNFSETSDEIFPPNKRAAFGGMGVAAPEVSPGQNEIVKNVTIIYEIK